jgi:hypothetical protein
LLIVALEHSYHLFDRAHLFVMMLMDVDNSYSMAATSAAAAAAAGTTSSSRVLSISGIIASLRRDITSLRARLHFVQHTNAPTCM